MEYKKQRYELNAVELLQRSGGLLAGWQLGPGSDPPDVLAQSGGCALGVEVRRLFADEGRCGSPQRRRLSLMEKIVQQAAEAHGRHSQLWYVVHVHFSQSATLLDSRVATVAEMLVELVIGMSLAPGDYVQLDVVDCWGPGWPEEVDVVSVALLDGNAKPEWKALGAVWVSQTSHALLQSGLDDKESRLPSFPRDLKERWLLLVCDGSVGSSALRFHDGVESESYQSSFDRAFVIDHSGKNVVELRVGE